MLVIQCNRCGNQVPAKQPEGKAPSSWNHIELLMPNDWYAFEGKHFCPGCKQALLQFINTPVLQREEDRLITGKATPFDPVNG